jgi:hypothetical protein
MTRRDLAQDAVTFTLFTIAAIVTFAHPQRGQLLLYMIAAVIAVFSTTFVLMGRTTFPKWAVALFIAAWVALLGFVTNSPGATRRLVLLGGLACFAALALALWGYKGTPRQEE